MWISSRGREQSVKQGPWFELREPRIRVRSCERQTFGAAPSRTTLLSERRSPDFILFLSRQTCPLFSRSSIYFEEFLLFDRVDPSNIHQPHCSRSMRRRTRFQEATVRELIPYSTDQFGFRNEFTFRMHSPPSTPKLVVRPQFDGWLPVVVESQLRKIVLD